MTKKSIIRYLTISLFVLVSNVAFGTGQFGDKLVYNNDTIVIFSNPLEYYWKRGEERTLNGRKLSWNCTACYRGYVATWKIENDSLFLIRLQDVSLETENPQFLIGETVEDFDLVSEFGSNRVHADWFTGEIRSQRGDMLLYIHAGYGSVFAKEQIIQLNNGLLHSITDTNYVEYDKDRLHPGLDYLMDTIERIIYNHLDTSEFDRLQDDENLQLSIIFDENGAILSVSALYADDSPILKELILGAADVGLKDFPKIRKVNHKNYNSPVIWIWFDAHCLKHPEDEEYGCEDYRKLLDAETTSINGGLVHPEQGNMWIFILSSIAIVGIGLVLFIRMRRK